MLASEANPLGFVLELCESRWLAILSQRPLHSKDLDTEQEPLRLVFDAALLLSGHSGHQTLSESLGAKPLDYVRWRSDQKLSAESLAPSELTFSIELRSTILAHREGHVEEILLAATDDFFALYPKEWSQKATSKLEAAIRPYAEVLGVKIQRREEQEKSIFLQSGGIPIGYYIKGIARASVRLDTHGKRLRLVLEQPGIIGNRIALSAAAKPPQIIEAFQKATLSYVASCEQWQKELRARYEKLSDDVLVFAGDCSNMPEPVINTNSCYIQYVNPAPEVWVMSSIDKRG